MGHRTIFKSICFRFMKFIAIILSSLLVIFFLFQSFVKRNTSNIEDQPYRVIQKSGDLEIRYYPPATMATVKTDARNYRELSSSGFRRVAGYIFGNNEDGAKIAMTSPVHMDIRETGSSMSFVMPSGYDSSNLPKPTDSGIEISRSNAEYAAALSFSGYASDKTISEHAAKLESLLAQKSIKPLGNYRFLGYDPPYQLIGRRNEVIVAIEWKETE